MHLQEPGRIDHAIQAVQELLTTVNNAVAHEYGNKPAGVVAHLNWVENAHTALGNYFDDDVVEGLYTDRYRQLHSRDSIYKPLILVEQERKIQKQRLTKILDDLVDYKAFAGHPGVPVVMDTSAFLFGETFDALLWPEDLGAEDVRLIVPVLVLEELDELKVRRKGQNERKSERALTAVKTLRRVLNVSEPKTPARVRDHVTIEVLKDDDWTMRRPNNDAEIIDQAVLVREMTGQRVTLACGDISIEARARQFDLDVHFIEQQTESAEVLEVTTSR